MVSHIKIVAVHVTRSNETMHDLATRLPQQLLKYESTHPEVPEFMALMGVSNKDMVKVIGQVADAIDIAARETPGIIEEAARLAKELEPKVHELAESMKRGDFEKVQEILDNFIPPKFNSEGRVEAV